MSIEQILFYGMLGFWIFLPAAIANMSPVFASQLPWLKAWNTPLDFGKTWRGKRIFGDNKRWRGLVLGTFVGGFVGFLQIAVFWQSASIGANQIILATIGGCLLGFGALVGDAIESFFKRQNGINPGSSWFPFDQLDYIVGGLLFYLPLAEIPSAVYWQIIVAIFAVYFSLHLLVSYIGFLLGFKDKPI